MVCFMKELMCFVWNAKAIQSIMKLVSARHVSSNFQTCPSHPRRSSLQNCYFERSQTSLHVTSASSDSGPAATDTVWTWTWSLPWPHCRMSFNFVILIIEYHWVWIIQGFITEAGGNQLELLAKGCHQTRKDWVYRGLSLGGCKFLHRCPADKCRSLGWIPLGAILMGSV